jgi:hypothetical protein
MASEITTVEKLDTYLGANTYSAGQKTAAVAAANDAIERYIGMTVAATDHADWVDGNGSQYLTLDNAPLIYVRRVCKGSQVALEISNTSGDFEFATVAVTDDTMTLTVVGGANAGTETLTLSDYDTMALLRTAILALSKGWAVEIEEEEQPKSIRPLAYGPVTSSTDSMAIEAAYDNDSATIEDKEEGTLAGSFAAGHMNIYVDYRAGYETMPEALVDIANKVTASMLQRAKRDMALSSEKLGDYSWTAAGGDVKGRPVSVLDFVKGELARFRRISTA